MFESGYEITKLTFDRSKLIQCLILHFLNQKQKRHNKEK